MTAKKSSRCSSKSWQASSGWKPGPLSSRGTPRLSRTMDQRTKESKWKERPQAKEISNVHCNGNIIKERRGTLASVRAVNKDRKENRTSWQ